MPDRLGPVAGHGDFALRPLLLDDEAEWGRVRWSNDSWLAPWESGDPEGGAGLSFAQWVSRMRQAEAEGSGAVFAMVFQTAIVGQISLGAIRYGSMRSGMVGYWVDRAHAGHGFAPLALALLGDWALHDPSGPRLHRLEVAILPENARSLRVPAKLGMRSEGLRPGYMFVRGGWRDHLTFSLLADDIRTPLVGRLRSGDGDTPGKA
ncbi:RimJ/RimL family protein N-acetyltransferase [Bifidobacterium xylocopae]|uniref:RimJ/RimL family protein N-acetyltransferase n=2 Tax=Bifidobacterium xylocopae TaxID=2493119 RepID=A0A366KDG9_9BIFI|nr:GNAT family protein [Bifidobacterium xylocopae]RBP99427.1 RimJ/RimL family protein N-acetyltransferase [Bifidobacterium xylocopae]